MTFIISLFKVRKQFVDSLKECQQIEDEYLFSAAVVQKMTMTRTVTIPHLIEQLTRFSWFMGYLSLADFFLYEQLYYFQGYCSQIIKDGVFERYMKDFQSL